MKKSYIIITMLTCCLITFSQQVSYKAKQYEIVLSEQFVRYERYNSQYFNGYKTISNIDSVGIYIDSFISNERKKNEVMFVITYYEKKGISKSEKENLLNAIYPKSDFLSILKKKDVTYNNINGQLLKMKIEANNSTGYKVNFMFAGKKGICSLSLMSDQLEVLEQYKDNNFWDNVKFLEY